MLYEKRIEQEKRRIINFVWVGDLENKNNMAERSLWNGNKLEREWKSPILREYLCFSLFTNVLSGDQLGPLFCRSAGLTAKPNDDT